MYSFKRIPPPLLLSISLLIMFRTIFNPLVVDAKEHKHALHLRQEISTQSARQSKKRLPLYSWNSRTGARNSDKLKQWQKWRERLTALVNDKFKLLDQHWSENTPAESIPQPGTAIEVKFVVRASRHIQNFSIVPAIYTKTPLARAIGHTISWASYEPSLVFPVTDPKAMVSVRGICIFENPIRFEPHLMQLSYGAPQSTRKRAAVSPEKYGVNNSRNPQMPRSPSSRYEFK